MSPPSNLTTNDDSDTALLFSQINSLGLALPQDGPLWLNGADLQWSDVLSPDDLNEDGSLNAAALLPAAGLSVNATYPVLTNLAENSTSVAGYVIDPDPGIVRAFLLVPATLAVDNDHDGNITAAVGDLTSSAYPYQFWLNDDPIGGGNETLRYEDSVVNGASDLKNFFPVFLNIQQLVAFLPPSDTVKYYLVQGDSAVNFVYTNLTRDEAYSYQTSNLTTGFGPDFDQAAASATTTQVTSDGVELSCDFLNNILNYNEGVILVEGRKDSTNPLELVVTQDDVTVADIPLYLSLGPRILLLLHGMNSSTKTWNDLVSGDFGNVTTNAANIYNGTTSPTPGVVPPLNTNGVRCYRLQFGDSDNPGRTGLEGITSANTTGYLSGNQCGDFETFDQLGDEVDAAVQTIVGCHWNTQIVLLGHSRGGLAARDFLENTDYADDQANVVALLTTSTPHQGSPLGLIYSWLGAHSRGYSDPPSYTSDNNIYDWNVVDFLRNPSITIQPFGISYNITTNGTLDVRRPVIEDVAEGSDATTALNANISNLPANITYGEIVYNKVDLGYLTKDHWWSAYSVFTGGWFVGPKMSTPAQDYLIGADNFPSTFPGDGLVPYQSAYLTTMDGFPGFAILPKVDTTDEVVHTQAPSRTNDLNTQLHVLEPTWFPPPP